MPRRSGMQLCTFLLAGLLGGTPSASPTTHAATASQPTPAPTCEKPTLQGRLNIRTATLEQWDLLPRIGPATAHRILTYREHRGFRKVSHLMRVKGIGRKTYALIRPYLALEGETTLQRPDATSSPARCAGASPRSSR